MQEEEINGEHLLALGLGIGINSSCCCGSMKTKKRKSNHDHSDDDKFFALLQARDQMLRLDPQRHGFDDGKGLQLIHLLLISATAVDSGNTGSAIDSLTELYRNTSLNGDPIQRVTAYFADGLAASLLTKRSPLYDTIITNPTPEEEFSAYTQLYRASPYYQFAHFTANQAIVEEFELEEEQSCRSLHVVDFDVQYGFQWPSLIQSLSDKATSSKPVSLRITGFGQSAEELRETDIRLTNFARGCPNLLFEFRGLLPGSGPTKLAIKKDETLVVNLLFHLQSLRSSSAIAATLNVIKLLNPSLVVLVEKEGGGGGGQTPPSFLSRFMESLHYFAAMFDSLDDCLKHETLETWKERMESNRFQAVRLSSRSVSQAKLLLKIKSHCSVTDYSNAGGFRIFERDQGRGLTLGWQDRHLITATSWRCLP